MGLVDSWNLKYEVEAEYPYSTVVVDTEQDAINRVEWEKQVHGVSCKVRVVGEWAHFRGAPNQYEVTDPWLKRDRE